MNITLPTNWHQLTDRQLELVYRLFARELSSPEVKTLCMIRWNKIKVIGETGDKKGEYWLKHEKKLQRVSSRQLQAATEYLNFMDNIPDYPVRYSKIGRHHPLNADFAEVPFETYMYADNLFQGYLHTENMDLLKELVHILYNSDKIKPEPHQCIMAFYWFAALKKMMANNFPHFFQPIGEVKDPDMLQSKSLHQTLMDAVNAQIRALTGGDVTKEPYIMKMDTIRALTELDAKAQEADEMRKQDKA